MTQTFGGLTFDPATLAADLLQITDDQITALSQPVIDDTIRRQRRADALARAQAAVTDYMQAGGSVATVQSASTQLIGLAQQLASENTPSPGV